MGGTEKTDFSHFYSPNTVFKSFPFSLQLSTQFHFPIILFYLHGADSSKSLVSSSGREEKCLH